MLKIIFALGLVIAVLATGCNSTCPEDALSLDPESMKRRQMQTRRFDTQDELMILSACQGLLQDTGFNIDEGESEAGLLVASKDRTAIEAGDVALAWTLRIHFKYRANYDCTQKLRASVVTRPLANGIAVRVTFQRTVWDDEGDISRLEALDDPEAFQEFFMKLSKAVFLEAHEI